jgi:molybdate transport system substrate-binding protein
MLVSMGIADAVHAKAILGKDGITIVEAVASGNADVGMTQASEIIGAGGVKFAGFIPDALNVTTVYSAAIPTHATDVKGAAAFLAFIAGPTGAARLRQAGWELER